MVKDGTYMKAHQKNVIQKQHEGRELVRNPRFAKEEIANVADIPNALAFRYLLHDELPHNIRRIPGDQADPKSDDEAWKLRAKPVSALKVRPSGRGDSLRSPG